MKIKLKEEASAGNVVIPAGEYSVALLSEMQQINLVGGGKDYKIPAIRRRGTAKTRSTTVSFYSGGGKSWSLLIQTPKHGEWIASIEYGPGRRKKA